MQARPDVPNACQSQTEIIAAGVPLARVESDDVASPGHADRKQSTDRAQDTSGYVAVGSVVFAAPPTGVFRGHRLTVSGQETCPEWIDTIDEYGDSY